MLGVLLDRGGQFLHRGGGLFQTGRLLLGAARQVVVAGGDLAGRSVDIPGGLLDAADDTGQALGGGVGVVAHVGEHAMELAVHARAQVAVGQCAEQARHFGDAVGVGVEQAVELLRQQQKKAVLAVAVDAFGQIAGGSAAHHLGYVHFDLGLGGAVAPFADETHVRAELVADRGNLLRDAGIAVTHLALRDALAVELLVDLRVLRVAHFQQRHRLAEQRTGTLEGRRAGVDVVGVGMQQLLQRAVGIDDGQVGIGDVHAGRGVVQRGADAQVLGGDAALAFDPIAQFALHPRQRRHQAVGVLGRDRDRQIQAPFGDVLGGGHRHPRLAAEQTRHRTQDPASGQSHAQHRQHHRARLLPGHTAAVLFGGAAAASVQRQDALADRAHARLELFEFLGEGGVGGVAVRLGFDQGHHLVCGGDVILQRGRDGIQFVAQCRIQRQFAVVGHGLAKFRGMLDQRGVRGLDPGGVLPRGRQQRGGHVAAQGVVHHVRLHMVAQRVGGNDLRGDRVEQSVLRAVTDAAQRQQRDHRHQHQDCEHVHDLHRYRLVRFKNGRTNPRPARDPANGR